MMWFLVVVTLVACGESLITISEQGFTSKEQCEQRMERKLYAEGPLSPGSNYACKELR